MFLNNNNQILDKEHNKKCSNQYKIQNKFVKKIQFNNYWISR